MFAVPLGFVTTALPAWGLGLITKGDVLDVFVRSGLGRFERLAVGVVVWSYITAVTVQSVVVVAARHRITREPQVNAHPRCSMGTD
jgi:hypothetical protein